jgi:hypothetical protein
MQNVRTNRLTVSGLSSERVNPRRKCLCLEICTRNFIVFHISYCVDVGSGTCRCTMNFWAELPKRTLPLRGQVLRYNMQISSWTRMSDTGL